MEQHELITKWAEGSLEIWIFYILAALAIPFAYGVVFDRAVIRSGFLLIGVFGSICGLFLLLQAQFIAMAQLMIYAVGITLVVVIALMLTNPKLETDYLNAASGHNKLIAFFVSTGLFVMVYLALRSETWPINTTDVVSPDNVAVIGRALTTTYALPFEFASVLLLAALVGAIMLAKAERKGDPDEDDYEYSEEIEPEPAAAGAK